MIRHRARRLYADLPRAPHRVASAPRVDEGRVSQRGEALRRRPGALPRRVTPCARRVSPYAEQPVHRRSDVVRAVAGPAHAEAEPREGRAVRSLRRSLRLLRVACRARARRAACLDALSMAAVARGAGGRVGEPAGMSLAVNAPMPQRRRGFARPVDPRRSRVTAAAERRDARGVRARRRVVRGPRVVGSVARGAARGAAHTSRDGASVRVLPKERELVDVQRRAPSADEARVGVA